MIPLENEVNYGNELNVSHNGLDYASVRIEMANGRREGVARVSVRIEMANRVGRGFQSGLKWPTGGSSSVRIEMAIRGERGEGDDFSSD